MHDGIQIYLLDVLGIRGWVQPDSVRATSQLPKILVLTPFAMVADERTMAQKMLNAAGFIDIVFQDLESAPDLTGESAEMGQKYRGVIAYGVTPIMGVSQPALELPSISVFLDSKNKDIMQIKRLAWSKIQHFKNEIESL